MMMPPGNAPGVRAMVRVAAKSGIGSSRKGRGPRVTNQRLTQQQRADGGHIARCRSAVVTSSDSGHELKLNYGMGLARDPRVLNTLQRESFFLTVLRPRSDTCTIALRSLASYFTCARLAVLTFLLGVFVSVGIACANADPNELGNTFCTGGPLGTGITFSDYRPVILNVLCAMILSFYVSSVVNEYKATYFACMLLRSQLVQFTTFANAEMSDQPGGAEVLLDVRRSLLTPTSTPTLTPISPSPSPSGAARHLALAQPDARGHLLPRRQEPSGVLVRQVPRAGVGSLRADGRGRAAWHVPSVRAGGPQQARPDHVGQARAPQVGWARGDWSGEQRRRGR